jgi:hypothetical protein
MNRNCNTSPLQAGSTQGISVRITEDKAVVLQTCEPRLAILEILYACRPFNFAALPSHGNTPNYQGR